ncbi:MAG: hypothetical protein HY534_05385 [Chloroflexi bacterium]|nr:hypothetical protein [Chloroflexota bacterium]
MSLLRGAGPHCVWSPSPQTVSLGLLTLTLAVRLIPAWNLQNPVADIATYETQADIVTRGANIYGALPLGHGFPFLPYSEFLPVLSARMSEAFRWPFDFSTKLPLIVADGLTTVIIVEYLRRAGSGLGRSAAWGLAWALNPVSILISAFHGSHHAFIPLLLAASFVAASAAGHGTDRPLLLTISALSLGLAVALRSFPVLFLPAFLFLSTRGWREAALFGAFGLLAPLLSAAPYLVFARDSMLDEMLGYSGWPDFGWASVLRSLIYFRADGYKAYVFDEGLIDPSKRLFLLAYGASVLLLPRFRSGTLAEALLLTPLLFYGLYGGVGAQYLDWIIPLGILARQRAALPYSVVATTAIVAFYAMYFSPILFGRYGMVAGRWAPLIAESRTVMAIYLLSNVALVALCLAWAARLLRSALTSPRPAAIPVGRFRILVPSEMGRAHVLALGIVAGATVLQLGATAMQAVRVLRTVVWP